MTPEMPRTVSEALDTAVECEKRGQPIKAERYCAHILRTYPEHPGASFVLGRIWIRSGDFEQGVELIERAIANAAGVPEAQASYSEWLGLAYLELEQWESAKEHFLRAIEWAPDQASSYEYAGLVYHELEDLQTAAGYFQKALQLDPALISAAVELGAIALKRGEVSDAIGIYERALDAAPDAYNM